MNPFDLVPSAQSLGVHSQWLRAMLYPAFLGHVLFMNILVGLTVIAVCAGLSRQRTSLTPLRTMIASHLPVIMALAINLGVAALLFLQILYDRFLLPSSQLMAGWWLLVVGLVAGVYSLVYAAKFRQGGGWGFLAAAVPALFLVAFLFTNNMTFMLRPGTWVRYFQQPDGLLLNLTDRTLIPRYLHFLIACLAVAGLYLAAVWHRREGTDPLAASFRRLGMKWFIGATICQLAVGFWFQLSLPGSVLRLFLGGGSVHTALLALSLVLVVQSLYFALNDRVWPTVASTLLVVAAMTLTRSLVRDAYLARFTVPAGVDADQYGALLIFLIALIASVAGAWTAVRLALPRSSRPSRSVA